MIILENMAEMFGRRKMWFWLAVYILWLLFLLFIAATILLVLYKIWTHTL